MRVTVKVKTGCRTEVVEEIGQKSYFVRTRARPQENEANERVAEQLAEHFDIPKSRVTLVHGAKSQIKHFEIEQ